MIFFFFKFIRSHKNLSRSQTQILLQLRRAASMKENTTPHGLNINPRTLIHPSTASTKTELTGANYTHNNYYNHNTIITTK